MVILKSNAEDLQKDLQDLVNLFYDASYSFEINHEELIVGDHYYNRFFIEENGKTIERTFERVIDKSLSVLRRKSLRKRYSKVALYDLLSKKENKTLPWGSLTGIRPTKVARDAVELGETKEYTVTEFLRDEYRVSEEKAKLIPKILKNQKCINIRYWADTAIYTVTILNKRLIYLNRITIMSVRYAKNIRI